jgi:hypothetical protein
MSAFARVSSWVGSTRQRPFNTVRRFLLALAGLGFLLVTAAIATRIRDQILLPPAISNASARPQVVVEQTVRDLGSRRQGSTLRASFQVRNAGSRRLILVRQSSGCDCLTGEPEVIIGPGRRRPVALTLDTHQFQGPIGVPIRYQTNDPARPLVEFEIRADIVVAK